MKKAIIVLLIAVVAMTAAFANTPDKNGFSAKVDVVGAYGEYGIEYNIGAVRLGVDYITASIGSSLCEIVKYFMYGASGSLPHLVTPLGVLASVDCKFLAAEHHELSVGARFGYTKFGGTSVMVDVEYGLCFNRNSAVYVRFETLVCPYVNPLEGLRYLSNIGYRYTF